MRAPIFPKSRVAHRCYGLGTVVELPATVLRQPATCKVLFDAAPGAPRRVWLADLELDATAQAPKPRPAFSLIAGGRA